MQFEGGQARIPVLNLTAVKLFFHRGQKMGRVEPLPVISGDIMLTELPEDSGVPRRVRR